MAKLIELFKIKESDKDVKNLSIGTPIEVLDKSPGAGPDGTWLKSRITGKFPAGPHDDGGYEYRAPWKTYGSSDVYIEDYGKNWRLIELN